MLLTLLLAVAVLLAAVACVGLVVRKHELPMEVVLEDYVTVVLPKLEALYGRADEYAPLRVDRALRETKVSTRFRAHAYALFCSHAAFSDHPACAGYQYEELRAKMLLVHEHYVERPWGGGIIRTVRYIGYKGR